jgi:hypothetical protein
VALLGAGTHAVAPEVGLPASLSLVALSPPAVTITVTPATPSPSPLVAP